jgi:hypothetical protein
VIGACACNARRAGGGSNGQPAARGIGYSGMSANARAVGFVAVCWFVIVMVMCASAPESPVIKQLFTNLLNKR